MNDEQKLSALLDLIYRIQRDIYKDRYSKTTVKAAKKVAELVLGRKPSEEEMVAIRKAIL